jgi:hypothetical protein
MCSSLDLIARRARVSAYIYSYPEYFQEYSVAEPASFRSAKRKKNQISARPVLRSDSRAVVSKFLIAPSID